MGKVGELNSSDFLKDGGIKGFANSPGGVTTTSEFPPYQQKNFYGQTINWAGGLHYRGNFNKTKDYLGDWTNVLFRN